MQTHPGSQHAAPLAVDRGARDLAQGAGERAVGSGAPGDPKSDRPGGVVLGEYPQSTQSDFRVQRHSRLRWLLQMLGGVFHVQGILRSVLKIGQGNCLVGAGRLPGAVMPCRRFRCKACLAGLFTSHALCLCEAL